MIANNEIDPQPNNLFRIFEFLKPSLHLKYYFLPFVFYFAKIVWHSTSKIFYSFARMNFG